MKILGGCASDIGSVRETNQDGILFKCIKHRKHYMAIGIVCDGIGGLEKGEVASAMIVHEINNWLRSLEKWIDISKAEPEILCAHLKDQVELWNEKLYSYKLSKNMRTGTTMSVIMLIQKFYYIIHVGDSRIYQYRNTLKQLTVDECCTRFENGRVKQYLDNYMGKSEELNFQQIQGEIKEGDLFLFCTDGMYHLLKEKDIEDIKNKINKKNDISESCKTLISEIIRRGETDNISLGIIWCTK